MAISSNTMTSAASRRLTKTGIYKLPSANFRLPIEIKNQEAQSAIGNRKSAMTRLSPGPSSRVGPLVEIAERESELRKRLHRETWWGRRRFVRNQRQKFPRCQSAARRAQRPEYYQYRQAPQRRKLLSR